MIKRYIIAIFTSLSCSFAIQAADLKNEIFVCADTKDSLSRLVCYDKLAQSIRGTATATEVSSDLAVITPSQAITAVAASNEAEDFGKFHLKKKPVEKDLVTSVSSVIAKVQVLNYGKLYLTLANNQIWQQTGNNKLSIKVGDNVELVKGMLSAIYLKKEGINKRIRVKRMK